MTDKTVQLNREYNEAVDEYYRLRDEKSDGRGPWAQDLEGKFLLVHQLDQPIVAAATRVAALKKAYVDSLQD